MRVGLTLVTSRSNSQAIHDALVSAFSAGAEKIPDQRVGGRWGNTRIPAYWLPNFDVWAMLQKRPPDNVGTPRFWNSFGVGRPAASGVVPVVQMNPPHEGVNSRVHGVFLIDERGGSYIGHDGHIGGGREGIGPKAFRKAIEGKFEWECVDTTLGDRELVVFGPFGHAGFVGEIARYIHAVHEFKESMS